MLKKCCTDWPVIIPRDRIFHYPVELNLQKCLAKSLSSQIAKRRAEFEQLTSRIGKETIDVLQNHAARFGDKPIKMINVRDQGTYTTILKGGPIAHQEKFFGLI